MAGPKLDGAGVQKLKTLDEAATQLQRLHGIVETYALALKRNQPTSLYGMQVKRAIAPLVGLLKPQFGLVADHVSGLLLTATRGGGGDQSRLRNLREGVAQLRMQLEIAAVRVKEKHEIPEEKAGAAES